MDQAPHDGEAGADVERREVGGDDRGDARKPLGEEREVMLDGLLDEVALGGQEGGVIEAQAR